MAKATPGLLRKVLGSWDVVHEGDVGLLYRAGVYQRELPPGRHRLWWRESVTLVPMLPQTVVVAGQEVLSADGYQPRLTGVLVYAVADAHKATVARGGAGFREALILETQLALRAIAAVRTAEDLAKSPRPALDGELLEGVRASARSLGLEVASVRLRDVVLPADLRRLLTGVEKARREGQVALERAHAEQAALRALANAARMLRNNPELQNLRLLQVLGSGATVVFGAPGAFLPLRASEPDPALPS